MFSAMNVAGFLIAVLMQVHLGAFQSSGRIKNVEAINALSSNLLTNPGETVQAYYDQAEPFADKASLRYHMLTAQRAFNLSLIDVRLVLEQSQEQFKVVFEEHAKKTNPLLKTPLTVLMNGFLQVIHKLNNFVSNANETVNNAMLLSSSTGEQAVVNAFTTVNNMQKCIAANNYELDINFVEEMQVCISNGIIDFTIEFNEFVDHLSSLKAFFPDAMSSLGDCLLVNENITSIRSVLEATKCLGLLEDKRFTEFYLLLNKGYKQMNNMVTTIFRQKYRASACRATAAENFKSFVTKNHISCTPA